MELEYADYRNPDQISMRCELSDWKTICSNPEMLKEIRRTTTVIEQITEILKGEYTAKLGVSNTLFLTIKCNHYVLTSQDFRLLSCLEHPVCVSIDNAQKLTLTVSFILNEMFCLF